MRSAPLTARARAAPPRGEEAAWPRGGGVGALGPSRFTPRAALRGHPERRPSLPADSVPSVFEGALPQKGRKEGVRGGRHPWRPPPASRPWPPACHLAGRSVPAQAVRPSSAAAGPWRPKPAWCCRQCGCQCDGTRALSQWLALSEKPRPQA